MRNLLAFACCTVSCALAAQQVAVTGQLGYAIGETQKAKKIMLVNEVLLTTSFPLHGLYSLVGGAGGGWVKFGSGTDMPNIFNERVSLLIPIGIRRSFPISVRSAAILELGLVGSFLIRDKVELRNLPDPGTVFRKARGRSLAAAAAAGYRYLISSESAISMGFGNSEDLFLHYPDPEQKLLLRKWMFSVTISRSLKQTTALKTFKKL